MLPRPGLLLPAALALAALALGCPEKVRDLEDPNAVATVNGESISRADFEQELTRETAGEPLEPPPTPEQVELVKRTLLDTLINRVLLQQAARQANVQISPEEVDRRVMRISSDYPAEGFSEALSQGQLTMAVLKQKTAQSLAVEKLFEQHVYPRVAVTEEELRDYYEAHKDQLGEPEQVRAAQIVVKGVDEARRIQAQLKEGKKFGDLARKYSLSADAKVGGDLGFFPRGVMPEKFDEVAFSLSAGQTSDVVETEYGFHLFKVLEKKPARHKELNEVRKQIEAKLLEEKRSRAQADYLKALRDKAQIQVNEGTLHAVPLKSRGGSGPKLAEP
ncbi:MAG TPA: peptidyl-prolyl cis-trans isomerase [Myxococcales bacterium]|nr:peptidyl-prolyl cis-trans isomerase [Myxococcales bacterium]